MSSSNRFSRNVGTRNCKPVFVIATEGSVTEPSYFEKFKGRDVAIKTVDSGQDSSPAGVLKSLRKYLKANPLDKGEEAWVVIDRDIWPSEQIEKVYKTLLGMRPKGQLYLALSNPKFEFWILLHFEDGYGVSSGTACDQRLKKYLPRYDKDLSCWNPKIGEIMQAIERAKRMDKERCDWPRDRGTTVYRLVEKLIPKDHAQPDRSLEA